MGPKWECVWANDIDASKEAVYIANFGQEHFFRKDIADVKIAEFAKPADLAWPHSLAKTFRLLDGAGTFR